jgi:hypothetical protein
MQDRFRSFLDRAAVTSSTGLKLRIRFAHEIHDLAIRVKESIDELDRFSCPTRCASLRLAV